MCLFKGKLSLAVQVPKTHLDYFPITLPMALCWYISISWDYNDIRLRRSPVIVTFFLDRSRN